MALPLITLPGDIAEEAFAGRSREMNKDEAIDGYIVQLPLPRHN